MTHTTTHPYHLVKASPWPILTGFAGGLLFSSMVLWFHHYTLGYYLTPIGLMLVVYLLFRWWGDVIQEGTYEGEHTTAVMSGLRLGVILFIVTEVFFFVGLFWAYFNSSIYPAIELGQAWPPKGIEPLNPWHLPLLNTFILLTSGLTATYAHHAVLEGKRSEATLGLTLTVVLGLLFTAAQFYEYGEATFTLASGAYGTTFYIATGTHGLHVIIGSLFLIVCLIRNIKGHFTPTHHVGLEAALWYWHFVDVVWLFLFMSVYVWPVL